MAQRIGDYRFLRMDSRDVTKAVERGCMVGITGLDWIEDYTLTGRDSKISVIDELGFGKARVCDIRNPRNGIREPFSVVSPFGNIAREYMRSIGKCYCNLAGEPDEVEVIRGKTEGWIKAGVADIVIDVVSSSKTVDANELEINDEIMSSQAVLVCGSEYEDSVRCLFGIRERDLIEPRTKY